MPGLVDFDGVLHRAPNLLEWQGIALAEIVADMLGRPLQSVYCDNEANLAALGELWFGRRKNLQDFVFVSGEIGVGAGIVIGGELFRGVRGLGGELGHVTVDPMGPPCSCGGRGCLERMAGQEALLEAAGLPKEAGATIGGPVPELVRRAMAGEPTTLHSLEKAGIALGIALSAFLNVLDLPTVVLGGFYAKLAPWLIGPLRGSFVIASLTIPGYRPRSSCRRSALKHLSGGPQESQCDGSSTIRPPCSLKSWPGLERERAILHARGDPAPRFEGERRASSRS